jgi:alkanesulfonate monooxygenase SsuD/methylene tetrahydromethanopterin reductase-like flavin-dependent oxidoreductase (luciferase family)
MRAGIVILPEHRWSEAKPRWQAAESYGFAHAWTYDHLAWRTLVDGPWFDAIPTLTSAALVTSKIRLGTYVASPNFRHPVTLARQLLTLDDVSGGRFTLGVGSGGGGVGGYDSVVLGEPEPTPKVRAARFAEFVELTDALLRNEITNFRGDFYAAVNARSAPGCVQQPRLPFLVAANGPKAMQVAARFGQAWVTTGGKADDYDGWWASIARLVERFTELGADIDRFLSLDGPVFSLSSVSVFEDMVGRARELGFTDVITHWPRPDGVYAGSQEVLERVASDVLPRL